MSASESLRDRLARLRRDARAPVAEIAEAASKVEQLPTWMRERLAAKQRRTLDASSVPPDEPSSTKSASALSNMQRASNQHGSYALRESLHEEHATHGSWKLSAVDAASAPDIAMFCGDASLESLDLRQAIYLDVETTGLSGGAGCTSFLVALGRFEGQHFRLWQGFLEGPEQERAMLFEVAERVRAAPCVVSFFGKSFDRHRLEDKMRLHRLEPPFADRPHLDLYHPLHRLYQRSVPNGRLCTMETTLCDVQRKHDLPGSFAPEAWFDYLGQRAHRLEAVFQHNADDVLSLVTLAAHLGRARLETTADGGELSGSGAARALAWAQLHGKRGQPAQALGWLELAVSRAPLLLGDREVQFEAGIWERRLGRRNAAMQRFAALADASDDELACRSLIELAKFHEHAPKHQLERGQALEAAQRAQAIAERLLGSRARGHRKELERRLLRLRALQAKCSE